jgi:hypothetical protein
MRLTRVFELIAQVLAAQEPLIRQHYGQDHIAHVVKAMEEEAHLQANKFLDLYMDKRQLTRKMRDMQVAPQDVDLRELAAVMDELCALTHHVQLFHRFILARLNLVRVTVQLTHPIVVGSSG